MELAKHLRQKEQANIRPYTSAYSAQDRQEVGGSLAVSQSKRLPKEQAPT